MTEFSPLEWTVLQALVRGEHVLLTPLAEQLELAYVCGREYTGTGCFVEIAVPPNTPPAPEESFYVGDVHLELEGLSHGAAAILFVAEGRISLLEMVAYSGDWPAEPRLRSLRYTSPHGVRDQRDWTSFDPAAKSV